LIEYHSKHQHVGFTTDPIQPGTVFQTTTYKPCVNLQHFFQR